MLSISLHDYSCHKILLVDDEPDVIMTLKAALQEAGFTVYAYEPSSCCTIRVQIPVL
jgi:CheY-like chemotaxis protein